MRLFVALPLPPEIADAAFHALPELPGLRRVRPELMHVTLAFLGRTPDERLEDVSAAAQAAAEAVTAFDIELDHVGRFPETGVPRIVWIGIGAGAQTALALGERVRREIDRRQLERDRKPLRAHVTLGRVREDIGVVDARKIAAAAEKIRLPHLRFRADRVVVFESVVSSKGPRYTARANVPLRVGGRS
ncbi:MAG TPA: RNA 2',3'-cyclic phosphodiesterase [Candidatus Limnocylindria bacterium]|nr:RNA 2',3'-cyclic phosphodiesterase [Candidatus Limnocylindria bacterium]